MIMFKIVVVLIWNYFVWDFFVWDSSVWEYFAISGTLSSATFLSEKVLSGHDSSTPTGGAGMRH